jgi:hypothetical protein
LSSPARPAFVFAFVAIKNLFNAGHDEFAAGIKPLRPERGELLGESCCCRRRN